MPKISTKTLMMIGQDVASLWGAVCTGLKRKNDSVIFYCNEHGDLFETEMTYKEIEEEYGNIR